MLTLSMHCLTEVTHCFSEVREREGPVFLDKAILKAFTEYLNATHFVKYHTCFCWVNIYEDSLTFAVSEDLKGELTFL